MLYLQAKDSLEQWQHQKLRAKHGTGSPLEASEGTQLCQLFDLTFTVSCQRKASVVLSYPVCGTLLQQPRDTNILGVETERMLDRRWDPPACEDPVVGGVRDINSYSLPAL